MLKELKFVQGAAAKKDFIPSITHFCIENGTVRAYNGMLALCAPIDCDIDCRPKAIPMVNAIAKCNSTISMSMTPTGKLSIRSGPFKALIECVADDEVQHHVTPEGQTVNFDGEALIKGLRTVIPFVGSDMAIGRGWSAGVLLKGQSCYATNNVCVVEYWLGAEFPLVVNIPKAAIAEMLRIGEAPTHAQVTDTSITFHYSDGRWVRSQLLETQWPDIAELLNVENHALPINPELYEGLDSLRPFMNKMGQVFINEAFMHTHPDISEGSSFDLPWPGANCVFALEMLQLLRGVATTADFSLFPAPCIFYGDRLRGAIIGMRL